MLKKVADGVWVRQSAWVSSNAIAPCRAGSDLNQLAADRDRLGIPTPQSSSRTVASCSPAHMLSDVLIPLLDPIRPDQVGANERALDRLGEARQIDVLVPGHGAVAEGPEVGLASLPIAPTSRRCGEEEEPVDARSGPRG